MKLEKLYSKKNNIFQSDIWAEFQKAVGRDPIEIGGAYFFKEHLIRDKYFLYCPKLVPSSQFTVHGIKEKIKDDKSIVFVRVEPEQETVNSKQLTNLKKVTWNSILSQQYSPKQTIVLDLTKSEDELLANMKSKHRYNLRLAKKKGVKIRQHVRPIRQAHGKLAQGKVIVNQKDVDDFYELSLEVSDRDSSYSPHPKGYYKKMVETIGERGQLQIFTAEYDGKSLSSIIILFYNDIAIYLHGASSNSSREVMPNHLAQWEAIREAKKRGCKYYDFWGTALRKEKVKSKNENNIITPFQTDNPEKKGLDSRCGENDKEAWAVDEVHSWSGVTKFKLGFVKLGVTGEVIEFPGAYDLPINKVWYNGLSVLNRVRKMIRK